MEDVRKLKKFGITLTIILLMLVIVSFYKNNIFLAIVILIMHLLIAAGTIYNPMLLNPVYVTLLFVSHKIGWINTRLLLIVIYYTIFSLIGLIFRILKKDLLNIRLEKQKKSYWIVYNEKFDYARYEKQY